MTIDPTVLAELAVRVMIAAGVAKEAEAERWRSAHAEGAAIEAARLAHQQHAEANAALTGYAATGTLQTFCPACAAFYDYVPSPTAMEPVCPNMHEPPEPVTQEQVERLKITVAQMRQEAGADGARLDALAQEEERWRRR